MLIPRHKYILTNYHIESRFTRLTTIEGYDFAFMPKGKEPATACWRYDMTRKRHNLIINEAVDEIIDRKTVKPLDFRILLYFAMRVYDHEGGHSLFTERDEKKLKDILAKEKIPFGLWNMMEDGRIEAAWRKKFHRRFGWIKYLLDADEMPPALIRKSPTDPMNPNTLFLDCVHFENSSRMMKKWVAADKDPLIQYEGKGKAKYGRRHLIRWYYRRAIHARTTQGVAPIVASWIKTFPESVPLGDIGDLILIGGLDMEGIAGGMPIGAVDADGKPHKPIARTISASARGTGDSDRAPKPSEEKDEARKLDLESKKLEIPRSMFFRSEKERSTDFRRADRLVRLFEKFLEGGEGMVTSRNPTNKINMNKFLRGADDFYIRRGDDPYGVKKISFIMDCSGSMSRAVNEGVYLAYILNELVRRRKIECESMIVCGGPNQRVSMPFDPRILDYLQAPGSIEGFCRAMRDHEKEILRSDITIFFTDGNITDEHINKTEWHRKGVYSIGLFVGNPMRSSTLHQWFDSVLVRNDIEAIADSLIQLIKRQ